MTSDLDTPRRSAGDRSRATAYLRDFLPGVVGYVVVIGLVGAFGDLDGDSPARFGWALLPVLPALWIGWAVLRHLRRVDEYEQLVLMRGLAVGFAVAMLAAVVFGMLAVAGVALLLAPWFVFAAGMAGWAVATGVLNAR